VATTDVALNSSGYMQTVEVTWHLRGGVKAGPGSIPLSDLKQIPPGIGSLILIRKTDALSAHLKDAMKSDSRFRTS